MLSDGARIAVVAPSGIFNPERLAAGLALLRSWGYEPVEGPNLSARHRFTAGTAEQRQADLAWALTSPDIDAAWFARGGYGTVHILDGLPWSEMDGRPIVGFSDATALFCAMERVGVPGAVHGPVLHSLADHASDETRAAVKALLHGGEETMLAGRLLCGPARPVSGRVIGGNLCMLASLAGTPWALQGQGAIVVLEDIGEPPYKLDRLITQLRLSGALSGVAGIALGEFSGSSAPEGAGWDIEALFSDLLAPLNVPVVTGLPIGHGAENRPWRYGAPGMLTAEGLYVG
jgi:muramoyltetrapeptide carboxypeptidase